MRSRKKPLETRQEKNGMKSIQFGLHHFDIIAIHKPTHEKSILMSHQQWTQCTDKRDRKKRALIWCYTNWQTQNQSIIAYSPSERMPDIILGSADISPVVVIVVACSESLVFTRCRIIDSNEHFRQCAHEASESKMHINPIDCCVLLALVRARAYVWGSVLFCVYLIVSHSFENQ